MSTLTQKRWNPEPQQQSQTVEQHQETRGLTEHHLQLSEKNISKYMHDHLKNIKEQTALDC